MAGIISISPQQRWDAAGWLFRWVLEAVAADLAGTPVAGEVREIADENLGWFGVDDVPSQYRRPVLRTLSTIAHRANVQLPQTVPNRPGVLAHLGELAVMAYDEGRRLPP